MTTTDDNMTAAQGLLAKTVVRVREGKSGYWDLTRPPLSDDELMDSLTDEQRRQVYAGEGISQFRVERDEVEVEDPAEVQQMTAYIRRYKSRIAKAESARKVMTIQRLLNGEDPETCRQDADVNYSIMRGWFHYKDDSDKLVPFDKTVLAAIKKAEKAAKDAKSSA